MIYLWIYLAGISAYCAWLGYIGRGENIEDNVAPIVFWPAVLAIALPMMAGWSLGYGVRFLARYIRDRWAKGVGR